MSGKLLNNDNGNFARATFTGHVYDTTLDMYHAEARFYDAKYRQFMSADPIKAGLNWYAYAEANPVTFTDPTGMMSVGELTGISTLLNTGKITRQQAVQIIFVRNMLGTGINLLRSLSKNANSVDDVYEAARQTNQKPKKTFEANIYLSFHEATQVLAAQDINWILKHSSALEVSVPGGEIDIVDLGTNEYYEVKPIYTSKGQWESDINKYLFNGYKPGRNISIQGKEYLFTLETLGKVYLQYNVLLPPTNVVGGKLGYYLTFGCFDDAENNKKITSQLLEQYKHTQIVPSIARNAGLSRKLC